MIQRLQHKWHHSSSQPILSYFGSKRIKSLNKLLLIEYFPFARFTDCYVHSKIMSLMCHVLMSHSCNGNRVWRVKAEEHILKPHFKRNKSKMKRITCTLHILIAMLSSGFVRQPSSNIHLMCNVIELNAKIIFIGENYSLQRPTDKYK